MKKFFSLMMIAAAFVFAACGENPEGPDAPVKGGKLATPELSETHTETSITVSWGAVENAEAYIVNLSGKTYNTEACEYTFENLNAGKYTIRVGAKAEGYEDSDLAKIEVTLTGATEVDWFEQTFTLPEQEDPEKNIYRCNTADFSWKGTGVKDLVYGIWATEGLEGVSDATIIANLEAPDGLTEILDEVNGDGFYGQFTAMLSGNSSYTLCVQVTNEAGLKFFTKSEVTTETAVPSADAKAWAGTWEVTSHKVYSIANDGSGVTTDKEEKFTITIETSPNSPNELYVYNYTVLGADAWPAIATVNGAQLFLMNGVSLGLSQDQSFYYYWLGWYDFGDGKVSPSIDYIPFAVVEMGEGSTTTATYYNEFELYDQNGNAVPVVCHAADIFGVSDSGNLYFLGIESFPAHFRSGQMEWVKVGDTASVKALNAEAFNPTALQSNVVVR